MYATQASFRTNTTNYRFEDELANEITSALRNSGYRELNSLEVIVDGHDVCVQGRVSTYFLRQKAEFTTLSHPSVGTFRSEIEVGSSH